MNPRLYVWFKQHGHAWPYDFMGSEIVLNSESLDYVTQSISIVWGFEKKCKFVSDSSESCRFEFKMVVNCRKKKHISDSLT